MVCFKESLGCAPGSGPVELTYAEDANQGFDPAMAEVLAFCSAWSYSDRDVFLAKLGQKPVLQGGDFMEISVVNDAMFLVGYAQIIRTADKRRIVVCFRGTEISNVVSWLTDAGTRKIAFPDTQIKVHSGFWRNWKEVWEGDHGVEAHLLEPYRLAKDYETRTNPETDEQDLLQEIYITGHSLGGAMGLLAALSLQSKGTSSILWNKLKAVYTFGQPMVVGCESRIETENRIGDKVYRFVYYNDLVPHLPPLTTGAFDHVGKEFKYIPRDTLNLKPNKGEWRQRKGDIDNVWMRPRSTQVFTVLGAAPFALVDFVLYNLQWLSYVKMPWSAIDHTPYFYVDSFHAVHPEQDNSCVIQ